MYYGDALRWHSHSLQLPDSTAGRESILALYKITYKGVTHIRLDVFLSNWKTTLFQGQLCPLKNDSTVPFVPIRAQTTVASYQLNCILIGI